MPVYNAGDFLRESIDSILSQTYKNFELIIVDDASTDDSWKTIANYKKRYPKITAIHLPHTLNRGGDACANVGFRKAKGAFIARMDADDIARNDRLAKQVEFLQKNTDVLMVGSQAHVINKQGKITGEKLVPTTHKNIYDSYFVFHPMIHPSVMIRRSGLPKRQSLYTIKYSANNDLYTFFELLGRGKFANMNEKLVYYRIHGKNDSLTKPKERFFNTLKIRIAATQKYGYKPTLKSIIMTLLQLSVIIAVPERLIVPLYLWAKGISRPVRLAVS